MDELMVHEESGRIGKGAASWAPRLQLLLAREVRNISLESVNVWKPSGNEDLAAGREGL